MTIITEGFGGATSVALTDWQHAKFANCFRTVLQNRAQQAFLEGLTQEDVALHQEAVEIIDRAIQVKNIDLIVTCHQYLIAAKLPAAVEVAFHVMKPMVTGKVCSQIKKEHIAFCETVIPMFPFEFGMSTDECYAVIGLGFEDITKAPVILELLSSGVTDEHALREALSPRPVTGKLLRSQSI